jgi:hypothetical protein
LQQTTGDTSEEQKQTKIIAENKAELDARKASVIKNTEAFQKMQAQVVESKNNALADAKAVAMQAAEYDALKVGLKGLQGNLRKIATEKYFDWINKIVSGASSMALFALATAKFNNAIAETADYLQSHSQCWSWSRTRRDLRLEWFRSSLSRCF